MKNQILMNECISLGDTRYFFRISKDIVLMKKYAVQNAIFPILVAKLASLHCTVQLTRTHFARCKSVLRTVNLSKSMQITSIVCK